TEWWKTVAPYALVQSAIPGNTRCRHGQCAYGFRPDVPGATDAPAAAPARPVRPFPAGPTGNRRKSFSALSFIAHANTNFDQEVEEILLFVDQPHIERRLHQRHGAVGQRPGRANVINRRHVFQGALTDARLDDALEALE